MDCSQIAASPEKFSAAIGTQKEGVIPNMAKYCSQRVFHMLGFSPENCGKVIDGCARPRPESIWLAWENGDGRGGVTGSVLVPLAGSGGGVRRDAPVAPVESENRRGHRALGV